MDTSIVEQLSNYGGIGVCAAGIFFIYLDSRKRFTEEMNAERKRSDELIREERSRAERMIALERKISEKMFEDLVIHIKSIDAKLDRLTMIEGKIDDMQE